MPSTDADNGTVYCTNCGAEISSGTKFCPECGANQEIEATESEQINEDQSVTQEDSGSDDDDSNSVLKLGKYAAWIWGGLLLLMALTAIADGSVRGIIAGVLALVLGLFFLPIVRRKSGVGSLPGVDILTAELICALSLFSLYGLLGERHC